jgi:predicted ATPase/class 3 adenylate cyclase
MPVFLFTDIEGSTQLWERHGAAMSRALARHDALLAELVAAHGGRVIKHLGDGVFAVFEDGEPLACALEIQRRVAGEDFGEVGGLRVRVAIHAGDAERRGADFLGPVINRTSRLLSAGWGGQILLTPDAAEGCPPPPGTELEDLGVHRLKDLSSPQRILALRHPDLPQRDFPALRTLDSKPHNLPAQTTPFVGREDELARLALLLTSPGCRLLTLLGPGGIGKTRLALQAAAERIEDYADGVWFVALAPLASPEFIVSTIAEALRFHFGGREDPQAQLLRYLAGRQLLLVMDNFEHLLDGAPLLGEILQRSPEVRILTTSRERLNLHAECAFEVGGLNLPPRPTQSDDAAYDAVQLFVACSKRVAPGARIREEDLDTVGEICRRMGGMPLGIELAASWTRTLGVGEILTEIDSSLDFLETSLRDAPERHRSLRGVFDYSWNLLDERERAVLPRLTLFLGGFDRKAAAEITGADLRLLASLADKSLLRTGEDGRYELHELVRAFGGERLAADPDALRETRSRFRAHYAEVLREHRGRAEENLAAIGREIANIGQAWLWSLEERDLELAAACVNPLYAYFDFTSFYRDGLEVFRRALEHVGPGDGEIYLALLWRLGFFEYRLGHMRRAAELMAECEPRVDELSSPGDRSRVVFLIGAVAMRTADYAKAEEMWRRGLRLAEETGDGRRVGHILAALGDLANARGEYAKGRELCLDGLALLRQTADTFNISSTLITLGDIAFRTGDYPEAERLFKESLDAALTTGEQWTVALARSGLGEVYAETGEYDLAERQLTASVEVFSGVESLWGVIINKFSLGKVALARGDCDEARRLFADTLEKSDETSYPEGRVYGHWGLGWTSLEQGDAAAARGRFERGLAVAREMNDPLTAGWCLVGLGEAAVREGDFDGAAGCFADALELADARGVRGTLVDARLGLARLLRARGERGDAGGHLRRALETARETNKLPAACEVLLETAGILAEEGEAERAGELYAFLADRPEAPERTRVAARRNLSALESGLDGKAYRSALERGRALTWDGAGTV